MLRDGTAAKAIAIRLVPNGISVGQINGAIITEAAHAAQGSIIMIKRAVFLHHNDDVFNIIDGAGSAVGGDRERPSDARREGGGHGAAS